MQTSINLTELRDCSDIGMYAVDRPIHDLPDGTQGSCVHATDFCIGRSGHKGCYNHKLYLLYPAMYGKDVRNEKAWQTSSGADYAAALKRKRKLPTDRARFMSRGEGVKDHTDIPRIVDICAATPGTIWWLPTRAWRDPILRLAIERELFPIENLATLASLDPETADARADLALAGWSTMFFGDDSPEATAGHFKCPKTWVRDIPKGHCNICKAGCFAPVTLGRRVDVHLKAH